MAVGLCFRSSACTIAGLLLGLVLSGGAVSGQDPPGSRPTPADTSGLDRPVRALFVRGLTQSYLEDYDRAVAIFEKALDRAPEAPSILSALAEAEAGRDNLASALFYARKARTHAPDTAYYHLEHARLLRTADRPEEALSAYRTLVSTFPRHVEGRRELAELLAARGRPEAALREYEALTSHRERVPPEVYARMLDLYRTTGNTDGLERTLRALIDRRPDVARYRRLLGRLYVRESRYEAAIPLFESVREEAPNDPRLLSQLKMLYEETGQPDKARTLGGRRPTGPAAPDPLVTQARTLYNQPDSSATGRVRALVRRALALDSSHAGALDLQGRLYTDQGRFAEAGAAFRRALDTNPRSPERWRRAAAAYLRADSAETAAALAEEGALLFPGRPALIAIEARARLRLGQYGRAQERFEAALAHAPSSPPDGPHPAALLTGLGRALQHRGRPARADSAYDEALRRAPDRAETLLHYARHLAGRTSGLDRAYSLAQRAVAAAPASPEAWATLGWVQFRRDRPVEARTAFDRAVAREAPSAWVFERFGDLHHAMGNETLARRYWKKALDRAPDRTSVRRKLRALPSSSPASSPSSRSRP
jgi:tetratricopeptide (TPR) repeat protein